MELSEQVEIVSLQSTAGYLFAADNGRLQRPLIPEVGVALAKEFEAADVAVGPGAPPTWFVRQATFKFSKARTVVIPAIYGNQLEFGATVAGTSEDARDVLREVWSRIGEPEKDEESAYTDFAGSFSYSTTATVTLPISCTELIRPLEPMMRFAKNRLGDALVQAPDALHFTLTIPLNIAVRGATIQRNIVLAPRMSSIVDDRSYFTVSPLPSEDHVEMLRQLVAQLTAT